jgi:hypothetical protein
MGALDLPAPLESSGRASSARWRGAAPTPVRVSHHALPARRRAHLAKGPDPGSAVMAGIAAPAAAPVARRAGLDFRPPRRDPGPGRVAVLANPRARSPGSWPEGSWPWPHACIPSWAGPCSPWSWPGSFSSALPRRRWGRSRSWADGPAGSSSRGTPPCRAGDFPISESSSIADIARKPRDGALCRGDADAQRWWIAIDYLGRPRGPSRRG